MQENEWGHIMKMPVLPQDVITILETLNQGGFEAYIVGGCVRDCILDREPQDWDITTSAEPEEVKAAFFHTCDTGIKHGTVTVVLNKNNYEVTTYRIESDYDDCRHPNEVFFTKNLKDDLLRRDFTMNAIAYHPLDGFRDYFDGMGDIKKGIIRGVGEASERFQEDALRMLRALRFSAQLGFTIEEKTYAALKENAKLIQKVSVERIRVELEKLLQGAFTERIALLWESGLLAEVYPLLNEQMKEHKKTVLAQMKEAPRDMVVRWTLLLQYMTEKEARQFLKYLKFDNCTLRAVTLLIKNLKEELPSDPYGLRKKAYEIGVTPLEQLLEVKKRINPKGNSTELQRTWKGILERGDCITLKELHITGGDVIAMGMEKGKKIGEILEVLLDMVHREPEKNDAVLLRQYVKKLW